MSKDNATGTIAVALIISGLCVFVGLISSSSDDYGFFNVFMPIMAVVAAFIFGIGTGLCIGVPEETETESESIRHISL